ncbi:uncharacterized protein LOC130664549 [Microplitis mediator]|uniref:uncharacterized protein LOC130664549 n=1 Tax=Microplitis mediator TaxID=375433 RepID=UPI0025570DE4|nr:uncharacterized protein LOC130664549 [Microplitis mediator]
MNSKVILLNIFYFIVVSANLNEDNSQENHECGDSKKFEFKVDCLADGTEIRFNQEGSDATQLYVDGYQDSSDCMEIYPSGTNDGSFAIKFDKCGVTFRKSFAQFNLTVLRPPNRINDKTKYILIQCNYPSKVEKASKALTVRKNNKLIRHPASSMNVSPAHMMSLIYENQPVKEVEAGKVITAKICITPKVFRAMIKKCNITTNDNKDKIVEPVTGDDGCPNRPEFGLWTWNPDNNCYQTDFRVFKFPNRGDLRIECDVHYCLEGQCRAPKCKQSASPCPDA